MNLSEEEKWQFLRVELSMASYSASSNRGKKIEDYKKQYWPKGVRLYKDKAYDYIFKVYFEKGKYKTQWINKILRDNRPISVPKKINQKLDEIQHDLCRIICSFHL